jgi:hypothetical protein
LLHQKHSRHIKNLADFFPSAAHFTNFSSSLDSVTSIIVNLCQYHFLNYSEARRPHLWLSGNPPAIQHSKKDTGEDLFILDSLRIRVAFFITFASPFFRCCELSSHEETVESLHRPAMVKAQPPWSFSLAEKFLLEREHRERR